MAAQTIKFAEHVHRNHDRQQTFHSDGPDLVRVTTSRSLAQNDGIYNIRSRSRSIAPRNIDPKRAFTSQDGDEDAGLRNDSDLKKAQVYDWKLTCWLAYQSVGVIYGDIGTSPLYVFSSTFVEPPVKEDLIGVLSLVLWSLIMMVTLKYVVIILNADNDGEGGTFSTYALLSRYMNITNRDPREASLVRMNRWKSGDLETAGRKIRSGIENSKFLRSLLKVVGTLAVSAVIADGVLTPAQSVLGAVQGIQVVDPTLSTSAIIGITDAILVVLFMVQPLGITKITYLFAPIIVIWLAFNAAFGCYNLAKYDATVFKAFNPYYAFRFLAVHKEKGWRQLGGVLLCFTGVEALFADLGAFSRPAIQLSWLCYCLPCLFLSYIGQAAYISVHPEAYTNPLFNSVPRGAIYPALIIAILAAIVASQAIITATFQLLAQIMKLSYFPQLKVVHTSKIFHGQLYVPMANWLLMVGTILVASIYNNTTRLGNAYGVCVMLVTFFDSLMVSLTAIVVWRISPYLVFLPWLTFASMDAAFLSSSLTKVPDGAWFTLTLAAILTSIFLVWRFGKEQQWAAEAEDRYPTAHFVKYNANNDLSLTDRFEGTSMSRIRGFGVFFDKVGDTTPIVFSNFAIKLTAAPEVMVFFHLRPLEKPSVTSEERHTVSRLSIPNCYRLVVRYGYNDEVVTPNLAAVIYEQVKNHLLHEQILNLTRRPSIVRPVYGIDGELENANHEVVSEKIGTDVTEHSTVQELHILESAFNHKVLYVIGKEQMKIKKGTNILRRMLLETFLYIRENTRNKMANLNVPKDRIIEVGFLKEI